MTYTEKDERRARIENLTADSDYKRGLLLFEPWKIVIAPFAAGGLLCGVLAGFIGTRAVAPRRSRSSSKWRPRSAY
jgi:hypothetical protein